MKNTEGIFIYIEMNIRRGLNFDRLEAGDLCSALRSKEWSALSHMLRS